MNHSHLISLADAYTDACTLLAELDKLIVHERYAIRDNDPLVRVRWSLAYWVRGYDVGELVEYADYLILVARAQAFLDAGDDDGSDGQYGF